MPFGISFFIPPLRHFVTPLLKERLFLRLQLRGAVNAVDCGVDFYNFHTSLLIFLTYHKYIVHMGLCPRRPFLSNLFLSVGTITLVAPFLILHGRPMTAPTIIFTPRKKGLSWIIPFNHITIPPSTLTT